MTRTYDRPGPLGDVLEEYLDEAAFLFAARKRCFEDARFSWELARDRERRLDRHLHGLVLGGRASADLLKEKLLMTKEDNPGETFVAAAVLPRLGLIEPYEWIAEALAAKPPHSWALIDGLSYTAHGDLDPWLDDFRQSADPTLRAAAVAVIGNTGLGDADERLMAALRDQDPLVRLVATSGLGQRGKAVDVGSITPLLDDSDPALAHMAARLLVAAGDDRAPGWLRGRVSGADPEVSGAAALLLAVSGDLDDVAQIRSAAKAHPRHASAFLAALGLTGGVAVVEDLLAALSDPADEIRFGAAWQALGTLSGEHRPPRFDFEEEGGRDAAATYAAAWADWSASAQGRMAPALKHRCGRPLSPSALVLDLKRPGNPWRDLTAIELRARYGCPLPFQPSARHEVQAAQLTGLDSWAARADRDYAPGAACYAGRKP